MKFRGQRALSWVLFAIPALAILSCGGQPAAPPAAAAARVTPDLTQSIRLAGTVEASRARTVLVPRMAGQTTPTLVITSLARAGSEVKEGDVVVEFDPQDQLRAARDRQADLVDLDGQLSKKRSDHAIARARDETELTEAARNVERAALDVKKNSLVARIEAEKNNLALEQAQARLTQLKETAGLKREAAAAELRILEIQRERAERALKYAEGNSVLMRVEAPFSGLIVLKQLYMGTGYVDVQEGQEVRPGQGVVDIVDPTTMQVRARLAQSDVGLVSQGQAAKVRLDAYPELVFDGRVESITPLGIASSLTPKVRIFTAVVAIHGSSPQLMPDLSASVEIVPVSTPQKPPVAAPPAP